jgi:formylglycine-generating enzyme required for sulfatase activity/dienelactone hydrolase
MLVLLMICTFVYWLVDQTTNVRWARRALPQIEHLVEQEKYLAAFILAQRAEKYIPKDPTLAELWPDIVADLSIITTPPGADVFFKEYSAFESKWEYLGLSPIENVRFPHGAYRWKIEKKGYETAECVRSLWTRTPQIFKQELHEEDMNPAHMVLIRPQNFQVGSTEGEDSTTVDAPAYWIDKYEVTNQQFKEFVDHGGYQRREYWKHEFLKDGKPLSWEQAMVEFRDETGRFGPSTWEGGTYPKGHEKYPVAGISWFEADAYAEFAGKSLPTIYHWFAAAPMYQIELVVPFSNFESEGPAPIGSHPGIGNRGLYDMAGNVKEWCWNGTGDSTDHRYTLGGAWSEPSRFFTRRDSLSAWDRSAANGFRCVRYLDGNETLPDILFHPLPCPSMRDYSTETPVSDEEFQQYMRLYAYDRAELNAVVESVDDSPRYWRREKITFDAAYGGERVIAYLFLPKGINPPYQTVIYFPGSGALRNRPFENSSNSNIASMEFILIGGRALLYPVYKGTYERQIVGGRPHPKRKPIAYRDWRIQMSKDLRRSIDYLETRDDINSGRLAYYGSSVGTYLSPIMLAVEDRVKAAVCIAGGLAPWKRLPEVDPINFAPHVKIPILMVNGKEDSTFPFEESQRPMYEFWGTADEHKKHRVFPGGHGVPGLFRKQIRGEILDWLDRYLGPVE